MALVAGTYGGVALSATQVMYANTIIQVGQQRNIPARGIVVALMTAMQESSMGAASSTTGPPQDHDSGGLFQQRPSAGWGTYEQVRNSVYATNKFYDTLLKVPGWQVMSPSAAAQAVQRSAFPTAYAKWQPMAEAALAAAGIVTGPIAGPAVGQGSQAAPPIDISGLSAISDPAQWKKIGWFLLGLVLFAIGLFKTLSSTPMGEVMKKVGKAVVLKKVPV